MKKVCLPILGILLLSGCYEDYVKDFDYSSVYVAYQYDLRTFVVGEQEQFKASVALSGLMKNDRDRSVSVERSDALVTEDICSLLGLEGGPVSAYDGMMGSTAAPGQISASYVTEALRAAGVTALTPLPDAYCTVEGLSGVTIRKGEHTAGFTVRATEALKNDARAFAPGYAIGYVIRRADADTVLASKSFGVIAVKCENRFWGYWRRSGIVRTYAPDGSLLQQVYSPSTWDDAGTYYLSSVDGNTLTSDKRAGVAGVMTLSFSGPSATLSSPSGDVSGTATFNGAKLLQDREIYLSYQVTLPDGGRSEVLDTLRFRNRIRDGINEWQDEDPSHYE